MKNLVVLYWKASKTHKKMPQKQKKKEKKGSFEFINSEVAADKPFPS